MAETIVVGCKLPHGLHLDLNGKRVTINGANSATIAGGHGITRGVDKEHFENWVALNKDHPSVKNGFIFAHTQAASVVDMAEEREDEKTGFEGIDPNKPGNGVEKADEQKTAPSKSGGRNRNK